jgi:O-antigen/teichoic acid export membrane protein
MMSYGLPVVPHRLQALGMAQFGQYMVATMLDLHDAGLYSIALRISMPVTLVVGATQQAWVPFKFQIHAQDESPASFFSSTVTYYVASISYLWVGVSLWGPEIVRLMTTASFHNAASIVPAAAMIPFSQGLYFMLGTGFMFSDSIKTLPLVSLTGLVVVLVGTPLLISWMGVYGAALSTVLGWLIMTVVIYFLSQHHFRIPFDWQSLILLGLLSVAIVSAGYAYQKLSFLPRIVIISLSSIVYPLIAFLILYYSKVERHRMIILFKKLQVRFTSLFKEREHISIK